MRFIRFLRKPKRVYLDYGAATPVRNGVKIAMQPFFSEQFANAGGIHKEAVEVRQTIDKARSMVAKLLGVREQGVIFTSGGTEANNLAILGLLDKLHSNGKSYDDMEVITTAIEHPSILETVEVLAKRGVKIVYAPVDEEGIINLSEFKKLLSLKTVLVTFAYANSEIGTIQPVHKLTRMVQAFARDNNITIRTHLDAAQAPLWLGCDVTKLGVDIVALDAGKCEGPKGVGVLAKRHGVELSSVTYGGGQEFGLRPGTENTPLIVGCATALELAQVGYETRAQRARVGSRKLLKSLQAVEGTFLNGPAVGENRLPNNINISVSGLDSEFAVITLDEAGLAASTRSACGAASGIGSHVVRTISGDEARAASTIRFTHDGQLPSRVCEKIVVTLINLQKRMASR